MTVITGFPGSRRAASALLRKAIVGWDGDKNQTWYARITRSKRPSSPMLSGESGAGFPWTVSGNVSKNLRNGHGNG
jgi:hypothetical protein